MKTLNPHLDHAAFDAVYSTEHTAHGLDACLIQLPKVNLAGERIKTSVPPPSSGLKRKGQQGQLFRVRVSFGTRNVWIRVLTQTCRGLQVRTGPLPGLRDTCGCALVAWTCREVSSFGVGGTNGHAIFWGEKASMPRNNPAVFEDPLLATGTAGCGFPKSFPQDHVVQDMGDNA